MMPPDFNKRLAALEQLVRDKLDHAAGGHDFDHTRRVVTNALALAAKMRGVDLEVVHLAALLHDIARPEEQAAKGEICHAALGAKLVVPILLEAGCSQEQAAAISEAIRTHRYRGKDKPSTREGAIVYDADKLDSLGAVGLGRAFLFAGHENARVHNTRAEALGSEAYSHEDTAWREYLVKLRKLPGCMLTAPGRATAKKRAAFMKKFFDELNEECGY
ncbi:MAG: HD domain-containing protein [Victivallaceae bacterium]|nr:HD domain-containing protein [Victivallaceae bacterium]